MNVDLYLGHLQIITNKQTKTTKKAKARKYAREFGQTIYQMIDLCHCFMGIYIFSVREHKETAYSTEYS